METNHTPERYVVHFNLDDKRKTPGKCSSDYRMEPGEMFDYRDERAIVYSCFAVKAVEARRPTNQGDHRPT